MIDEKLRASLGRLKRRYFFKSIKYPNGAIGHLTGCGIRNSKEHHGFIACTCGLLRDLEFGRGHYVATKIFPPFNQEMRAQVRQSMEPQSKEEHDQCTKILQEAFPNYRPMTTEERASLDEDDWEVIVEVFGSGWVNEWRSLDHDCGDV